ncbi:MAG: sulfatase [Prosthecobacter sp.]|jgi:N-sulfoglucosamine sulfohydrolase|uniref:sulfatase family protein n=1 Tax=Prosthecobacter sp. TaxID=1965333 RepID=UPI0019F9604C|nr:sulfatase [Prosthecobacter sp.]MBE2285022.1 sulfatase [Prosthecobacter sp.]
MIIRLLLCCLALAATIHAQGRQPNILWLIAEDFGPHLGCYGTKEVSSPVLDALAAKGMRFTRFYTTAPVCSASRSAFNTGMYQTTIGAHNHRSHRDDGYTLPAGVKLISERMRGAGYFTANVKELPPEAGFKGSGKTDWNFAPPMKPFDSSKWDDLKHHQPFYAQLNFQETHRTFHGEAHADPAKVEIPPYYPDHEVTRKDWAQYLDAATELDRKIGKVMELLKRDGLLENTVICFFGDNGQAHVRGKQFCYEEGLNVPLIMQWPSGVPAPQGYEAGRVSDQLLMSIDLTASSLDWAGVTKPKGMQGRVFMGAHAEPPREHVFGARDRCDMTVFRFRTVADARYRYIHNFTPDRPFLQFNRYKEAQYPVWNLIKELAAQDKLTPAQAVLAAPTMPEEELYDLQNDPFEVRNLAQSNKPEDRAALERLRGVLNEWIERTNDQGRIPEPEEVAKNEGSTKPPQAKKGKKKAK